MADRHILRWAPGPEILADLPAHISRRFIPTPSGRLEVLVAEPGQDVALRSQALVFQHGGFGSAGVWIPFLTFFSQVHGFRCYALSLRGHGISWKPSFYRLVFGTGVADMALDLGFALAWVEGFEAGKRDFVRENLVLIGHSAGGGLSQYFLSRNLGSVGGLVIMAGFPCFGGLWVYWNWFKLDPWFVPRFFLRDLWHPRSPLSSTSLVHRAFFCPSFPADRVRDFERFMPEYESLLWPRQMMLPFINVKRVLANILGWSQSGQRLLIVAGGKDTLMRVPLMRQMASQYRQGFVASIQRLLFNGKKIGSNEAPGMKIHEDDESSLNGVKFVVIKGSGHHLQNDLQWEECAIQVLEFLDQL